MTLQSADTITGGAGKDMLNVTIGAAGTHQASDLTGVETVKGTFSAAGTLSLLGSTGVTHVKAAGSTAAATVTNIPLAASLEVENSAQNATFTYKATEISGSADAATLTLNNVTTGSTISVAGIETLNVVSGGGGNVLTALTVAAANTVNITGAQSLDLGAANTTSELIDGSAVTAALTIITNNTNPATVKTGSGKDSITSTGGTATIVTIESGAGDDTITHTANLGSTDVINGGDGIDTLVGITANLKALAVSATAPTITNMEAVTVSDEYIDTTSTIDIVSDIQASGITTVTLGNVDTTAGDDITSSTEVLVMGSGAMTLNLGGSEAGNQSHLGGTLEIQDTGTATTDSLAIVNKAVNSTSGANVNLGDSGTAITSTGYETVSFDTGSGAGNTNQALTVLTITPDAVASAVSLTVTGSNGVDFATSVSTTSTGLLTINASGMAAQAAGTTTLDIATTVQGTAGTATITGSGGDDNIAVGNFASTIHGGAGTDVISGGTAADTINGDAGNDTISGLGGNDIINGGAGNDTITATTAGNYTVTGGDGTDSVDFGGTLTQADSFDGGAGTDTLTLNNDSVTAVKNLTVSQVNTLNAGISNVEILDFGTTLAQDIDLGRLDGMSSVLIGSLAGVATLSGLAATNNIEVSATAGSGVLTLGLTDATGTADVVNVNFKAAALIDQDITAANVETINFTGNDAATGNASTINVSTLVATKATTVTVSGNDGFNLTNTGNTKITTFDASGVVANDALDLIANMAVTFVSANTSTTAAVAITGGAGSDSLTGGSTIDTIIGGAGEDTIVASAGNDVVDAGTGNDTVTFSDTLFDNNSATTATHTGGAGTDILTFSGTATVVDADFARLTSFETFTLLSGTSSAVFASEADATGITVINGGSGADTIDVSSVDFDNAVTIKGGVAIDAIALGTQVADVVLSSGLTIDTLSGFTTGTDDIQLDLSDMEVSGATVASITMDYIGGLGTSVAAGDSIVIQAVAGASILTAANVLNYTAATTTDASTLETALEASSGLLTTGATGVTQADSMFIMYDNSSVIVLATLSFQATVAANTKIAAVEVTDLVTLTGVTADLVAGDLAFIA